MTGAVRHGLTPREQDIMERFDAGSDLETIAEDLALSHRTVLNTIRSYDFDRCWANSARFERSVRDGEAEYRAALAISGGRYE